MSSADAGSEEKGEEAGLTTQTTTGRSRRKDKYSCRV